MVLNICSLPAQKGPQNGPYGDRVDPLGPHLEALPGPSTPLDPWSQTPQPLWTLWTPQMVDIPGSRNHSDMPIPKSRTCPPKSSIFNHLISRDQIPNPQNGCFEVPSRVRRSRVHPLHAPRQASHSPRDPTGPSHP